TSAMLLMHDETLRRLKGAGHEADHESGGPTTAGGHDMVSKTMKAAKATKAAKTTKATKPKVTAAKRRPKPNRPFGQFIKWLAIESKVTPTQLAEHCGVSRGAVSNWFETGSMSKMNLVRVAERLGTTVEPLLKAFNASTNNHNGVP